MLLITLNSIKRLMLDRIRCTNVKKITINVTEGSPGRVFFVFPDVESAYTWLTGAHEEPEIIHQISDVDHVTLLPGEFIEAEWRGCEIVYDDKHHTNLRIDFVRLAKASRPSNASGLLVSIHYGWVSEHIMPFRNYADEDVIVTELSSDDAKFDLTVLFKDSDDDE